MKVKVASIPVQDQGKIITVLYLEIGLSEKSRCAIKQG